MGFNLDTVLGKVNYQQNSKQENPLLLHPVSMNCRGIFWNLVFDIFFKYSYDFSPRQKFSIRHDYKINSWILEKPGNSWKILEKIWTSETGFIPDLLFIPDFILDSRIWLSRAPTNHPTILLDILCLANLNGIFLFYFLGFA